MDVDAGAVGDKAAGVGVGAGAEALGASFHFFEFFWRNFHPEGHHLPLSVFLNGKQVVVLRIWFDVDTRTIEFFSLQFMYFLDLMFIIFVFLLAEHVLNFVIKVFFSIFYVNSEGVSIQGIGIRFCQFVCLKETILGFAVSFDHS